MLEAGTLRRDRVRDERCRTVVLGGKPVADLHTNQVQNMRFAKRMSCGSDCYLTRYQR